MQAEPVAAASGAATAAGSPSAETPAQRFAAARADSLREQSSLNGGTGLLHLQDPLAGAAGTFRVGLLLDTYAGNGFLCNAATPCTTTSDDSNNHFGTTLNLSVTPLAFLEAYASLRSFVSSDTARTPSLTSSVGNTDFAVKLFTPQPVAKFLRFGGAAELAFLGSSGSVGLAGNGTSARFLALVQADFRGPDKSGVPLRVRLNLGYFLDNSGNLVKSVEAERNARITRIERSGLDINRVDQFELGLGVDAPFSVARPFVEWNLGVPVNRQGYRCYPTRAYPGDGCLATSSTLAVFPSKLTFGSRFYPWLPGLAATAAFDVGTSGTSRFIEELAPTLPWDLWLGASYAFDATPPPATPMVVTLEKVVPAPAVPERRIRGFVHASGKSEGIAKAVVSFQGRELTGVVTSADGHFVTQNLEPGNYTLEVEAPAYETGECAGTITVTPDSAAPNPAMPKKNGANASKNAASVASEPTRFFDVDCELVAAPPLGNLSGHVRDAGGALLTGAAVKLKDRLGRELAVDTDATGAFSFERIVAGTTSLSSRRDGYLLHTESIEVGSRESVRVELALRPRPKPAHVKLTAKELMLTQPIRFDAGATQPTPDSLPLLEEVSDAIQTAQPLTRFEIQAYTDASGSPERDQALTEERASAVRAWLTQHGVEDSRLSTKGFGATHPVSPNVTLAGRARNRRVRFAVVE